MTPRGHTLRDDDLVDVRIKREDINSQFVPEPRAKHTVDRFGGSASTDSPHLPDRQEPIQAIDRKCQPLGTRLCTMDGTGLCSACAASRAFQAGERAICLRRMRHSVTAEASNKLMP
ncbi:MAG: hypothetical protein ACR2IK_20705 [Chloroflexota bacterium]